MDKEGLLVALELLRELQATKQENKMLRERRLQGK